MLLLVVLLVLFQGFQLQCLPHGPLFVFIDLFQLVPAHIADHGRYKLIFYGFKSSSNVVDGVKLRHL